MSNQPEPNDDVREMLSRLESEFSHRPTPDAVQDVGRSPVERRFNPEPPRAGEAAPLPPQAGRRMQLQLPRSQPRVVYALIAINVLMYLVATLVALRITPPFPIPFSNQGTDAYTGALYMLGAKWGPAINAGQYWRLLTPMILHGGLLHLAFNSYATYSLGPEAERVYGTWRFLAIYLLAGFGGNVASYVINPGTLAIGASGAIFGLIGALAAFSYAARSLIGAEASQQQVKQLVGLAMVNLFLGFALPGIDNSAHIGGLIAGGLAGLALAPRYAVDARLYPPTLVPQGRPALGWAAVAALLIALVAIAAWTIRSHVGV